MKKFIATLLILAISLFALAGCGAEYKVDISPYDKVEYDKVVTLPDYSGYEAKVPEIEISDEDVESEIQRRLDNASQETEEVTEGKVEKGDTVKIDFKGTLEDGTSLDGMSAEDYPMTLGSAPMIDGFQEGIYGATIGEAVTLNLEFPDPYEVNKELSGKKVTFVVTVKSKTVPVKVELNEEFFENDSEKKAKTEEEYREFIKNELKDAKTKEAEYKEQSEIYYKISENSEINEYPEEILEFEREKLLDQYKKYAEQNKQEWDTFVSEYFGGQEEFDKQSDEYVKNVVGKKLIAFALADKEGVKVTDKEYTERLEEYLETFMTDAETFEKQMGMSIVEYCNLYEVPLNMYLDKALQKIYDDLTK